MKTLIGSAALSKKLKNFRPPKDLDYLSSEHTDFHSKEIDGKRVEFIPAPSWWVYNEVAHLYEILTLKASHIFWTPTQRDKHLRDIATLLNLGYKIDRNVFYALYEHWEGLYGPRSQSDQSQKPDDFFDDFLNRKIPHDEVHLLLNPCPVYKKILVGDGSVNISEEKFEQLTDKEKFDVVREEVYVLSYERWDDKETTSHGLKYRRTLNYFIGHLAPTWLALFAMENYLYLSVPEFDYKKRIEEKWKHQNNS